VRGTLGEYVAYKSYIIRKRECAQRPDTQNKIKMILIHILLPRPHSEEHTFVVFGRAQAEAARAVAGSARAWGGGGGRRRGAGRRAGKRGGQAKRRILTSPLMLSLS
jgi:hypothetical protein